MLDVVDFIDKYYDKAIDIKKRFVITENKKWDALTVLSEMNVQFGHFSYLICDYKEYGEFGRNIHDLGDELSDIVLQLICLCWKLNLDLKKFNYEYNFVNFKNVEQGLLAFSTVYGQVSETVLEIKGYRHYKIRYNYPKINDYMLTNIAKLFEIVFSIARILGINLNVEFNKMLIDASKFLDNYEKETQPNFFPIVDVHATWLVLNPVQGCPKQCKYCFLKERGLNRIKPIVLTSPEEAVDMLLKSKFYISDIPLCLFSQTDAFSTLDNIEYLKQLIILLVERKAKNPIVFITKCKVPDDFIDFIDVYEKQGHKFLFFLSYSGLDKDIEIGVNRKIIKENFVNLYNKGKKIIHYWRPFIPQNSKKEDILEIYNFVKKYCVASVAIGLKTTDGIIDNIDWDELKDNRSNALKSDNVWNKDAYNYLWNELVKNQDYPIFQTTSCALGYALKQPDRKFFYETDICLRCNKCPIEQRDRCKIKQENFSYPEKQDVIKLIKSFDKKITDKQIEFVDKNLIIKDIELNFNEISFITDYLSIKTIVARKEDDYYWNTSINNSSILKI